MIKLYKGITTKNDNYEKGAQIPTNNKLCKV